MYYSDDIIEEVRSRSDIVDVIAEHVHLQKKGANYFGLCPFHNEKSPSFSVSPAKQIYYCFGCGEGGNVYSFLMKYDSLTFQEAVEQLAGRAGITLPQKDAGGDARKLRDRKQRLLEINKEAATYYYYQLRSEKGRTGYEYFKKRGLTDETMHRFGLGFAAISRDDLVTHLRRKGYSDAEIIDAGLAVHDEKSGTRDKFWNRVMFPIQDVNRRVIGFGGRVMGDAKPKYLNSPETAVFDKGRNLYGLNFAKNARTGRMILCEGYMDVIAMQQAGFTEAVASLGTAFTTGQAMILKRYVKEVVLSYDSDGAGIKAALRGIGILNETGMRGKILHMEPYKDPDECIRAEGREAFERRVLEAENPFFFECNLLQRQYDMKDPEEKTQFHRAVAEKLCGFEEVAERENYLQAAAARYGIAKEALRGLVLRAASSGLTGAGRRTDAGTRDRKRQKEREAGAQSQKILLGWLAGEPALYEAVRRYVTAEDFSEGIYREVAKRLFAALSEASDTTAASAAAGRIVGEFQEEADRRAAAEILDAAPETVTGREARAKALRELIYEIRAAAYERQMDALALDDREALAKAIEGKKQLESLKRADILPEANL